MGLFLWILASIIVAISIFLLSVFDEKRNELGKNIIFPDGSFTALLSSSLGEPEARMKQMNRKLHMNHNKAELSDEKLIEANDTLFELEVTSGEVQRKYCKLLGQLKSNLAKTENEFQNLHDQIELITSKREKVEKELLM